MTKLPRSVPTPFERFSDDTRDYEEWRAWRGAAAINRLKILNSEVSTLPAEC